MGWYFFQFVDFINVDMLTVIFFKNCYEKMEHIYILNNLKQAVTVEVNQLYFFALLVSH